MPVGVCEFDSHLPHKNRRQSDSDVGFLFVANQVTVLSFLPSEARGEISFAESGDGFEEVVEGVLAEDAAFEGVGDFASFIGFVVGLPLTAFHVFFELGDVVLDVGIVVQSLLQGRNGDGDFVEFALKIFKTFNVFLFHRSGQRGMMIS